MKVFPPAKHTVTKEDEKHVLNVLRSSYLSKGPYNKLFEKSFSDKFNAKYAHTVSSGTTGLHLAMLACGIGAGDEVITTPFSYIASANCIAYVGAKPVFVDISLSDYNIDVKLIEKAITKKTKAILVVHIFGQAADMKPIMKIAKKYNLIVIEDACEALGSTYENKFAGSFGDIGVFAFFPNKQIISGEGGMMVMKDKKVYQYIQSIKDQGIDIDSKTLQYSNIGYNYRMDEMSAALGYSQLQRFDSIREKRKLLSSWYNKYLSEIKEKIALPNIIKNRDPHWFVYVIRLLSDKYSREQFSEILQKQGVSTRPYFPSIHLQDPYKKLFGYKKGDFPVSEYASENCVALPFYIGMTEKDVQCISKKIINILK